MLLAIKGSNMTRHETVQLVSRAIAVIQFVTALEEISYLPIRIFSAHHYGAFAHLPVSSYLATEYHLDVAFLFFRIALLLTLAWAFWACGPRIARLLLPSADGNYGNRSAEAAPGPADAH